MTNPALQFETMDLDDFEELLADMPADERWELIGGRVVRMMAGARWEHNVIIQNLAGGLRERLRASASPCRTLTETFRLRSVARKSSLLPDIIVHCRPLPPGAAAIEDATVLVEVLSEGTRARDRWEKWAIYQTLPGLMHYALVERDRAHVEVMDRTGGSWSALRPVAGLDATLALEAIGVGVPLSEIYRDVAPSWGGAA